MIIEQVFGKYRIAGLVGDKSTGKTNNLMALLKDFRIKNKATPIYVYGLDDITMDWAKRLGRVFEVSSMEQLADKKDSLVILDEMQRLKLNDRRYTDEKNEFVDFICHNNNWAILSGPNLREFNSNVGGIIERWLLKTMKLSSLVNGSQLKDTVMKYNGRYKVLGNIEIPNNKLLVINDDCELVVELDYIKEIDNKVKNVNIFTLKKE